MIAPPAHSWSAHRQRRQILCWSRIARPRKKVKPLTADHTKTGDLMWIANRNRSVSRNNVGVIMEILEALVPGNGTIAAG